MAGQSIGSAALIIKANASQLDSTLKKTEKDVKGWTENVGKYFKALIGFAIIKQILQTNKQHLIETAAKQRELNELITDEATRRKATDMGLMVSKEENKILQERANTVARMDRLRDKAGIGFLNQMIPRFADEGFEQFTELMINSKFGRSLDLSNDNFKKVDLEAEEKFLKKAREASEATKAIQQELNKTSASIGKTADQTKIWELRQKGVNEQMLRFFTMHMRSNEIRKFTDDLQTSMNNLGKTAGQIRLGELVKNGIQGDDYAKLKLLNDQAERMQDAFGLIEKNPLDVFSKQQLGLQELLAKGTITWNEYGRAVLKVNEGLIEQAGLKEIKNPSAIIQGSKEDFELKIRAEQQGKQKPEQLVKAAINELKEIQKIQLEISRQMLDELKKDGLIPAI